MDLQETTTAPALLLPYQSAWVQDAAQIKIAEKGRRTGLTFAEAADNVLIAASSSGENVYYISGNYDMAREYIDAVALWAKAFDMAASDVGEGIWEDDNPDKHIKTFEVVFPGGSHRITALSSRPTNLRGKQGTVVIDEAAFAPDLGQLLKAALAMTLRGSRIRIISTHDGVDNEFNELIQEARAGKRGSYGPGLDVNVHHIPFSLAVSQGMYHQVCARAKKQWTQEAEDTWVAKVKAIYGDDGDEELEAIPSQSSGNYLPLALISARMAPATPLVRGKWDVGFALLDEAVRRMAIKGWLAENLDPIIAKLNPLHRHRYGWDFARVADLSVLVVTAQDSGLVRRVAFVVELANCPFSAQEQILWHIIDRLPRFSGGAMDAGGNGAHVAETTAQRYGVQLVHQVKLSRQWYVEHMPKLKANLEDATLDAIPRDEALQQDLRAIKVAGGVPQVSARTSSKDADGVRMQRHGDFAIAVVMECYIAAAEIGEIAWDTVSNSHGTGSGGDRGFMRPRSDDGAFYGDMAGW
jgi:phage FluMu gp28-like protein